jgi:hypothetical protein
VCVCVTESERLRVWVCARGCVCVCEEDMCLPVYTHTYIHTHTHTHTHTLEGKADEGNKKRTSKSLIVLRHNERETHSFALRLSSKEKKKIRVYSIYIGYIQYFCVPQVLTCVNRSLLLLRWFVCRSLFILVRTSSMSVLVLTDLFCSLVGLIVGLF